MTLSITKTVATTSVAPAQLYAPQQKPYKPRLVAHWVLDRDNKLCCQWFKE